MRAWLNLLHPHDPWTPTDDECASVSYSLRKELKRLNAVPGANHTLFSVAGNAIARSTHAANEAQAARRKLDSWWCRAPVLLSFFFSWWVPLMTVLTYTMLYIVSVDEYVRETYHVTVVRYIMTRADEDIRARPMKRWRKQ